MPTLNWIGKEAVVNHHQQAPFHLLKGVLEQVVANCDHLARFIKIARCEVEMGGTCRGGGIRHHRLRRAGAKSVCSVDSGRSQAA